MLVFANVTTALALGLPLRVFGAGLPGLDYSAVIVLSAALWTVAFAFFLWVYGPILLTPRVDPRSTART